MVINDLFEEGDRDYHFFYEFFGFVGYIYPEPYMKNPIDLNKNAQQQLADVFLLTSFLIASNAYVGFHMKEYGKLDRTFSTPKAFDDFIQKSAADDPNYFERITAEDRYTVGLVKIQAGAKAPPITPEIQKIFGAFSSGTTNESPLEKPLGSWKKFWRR
ncbi:hypothetical protein DXT88_20295 [Herbaspirillum lusitanum]|nr:hypothetical protein [Herbaspirillum lusitanum]